MVTVYLDGAELVVPSRCDCSWAARGALGLARGVGVRHEGSPAGLTFARGHTFRRNDSYVTFGGDALVTGEVEMPKVEPEPEAAEEDADDADDGLEPWAKDPEFWKHG